MKQCMIIILTILLAGSVAVCGESSEPASDRSSIQTYRDIPGITDNEIAAIEALKNERNSFSYGQMEETEAFIMPDGTYGGFAVNFCELLSRLFGIDFVLELYDWDTLKGGIDSGQIDFTGDLTPTPERMQQYYMTHPIAERYLRIFQYAESNSILTEKDISGLKVGSLIGTIDIAHVQKYYPELAFTVVDVESFDDAAQMLKSGQIDVFISEGVIDPLFDKYGYIKSKELFHLVYTPVSLTTINPELEPVISVVNKYLTSARIDVLYDLYKEGNRAYLSNKLSQSFTEEESAYLRGLAEQNSVVYVALEQDNYPVSFYNTADQKFQGIAVDVLSEIRALTGIHFETANDESAPWAEILNMLKTGEVSLVSQLLYSEERKGNFLWPDKPYASANYALISKSEYPTLASYQVLRAKVGAIRGSAFEDKYKEWFPNNDNLIMYESQDEILDALERDKIDLLMGSNYLLLMQQNYREKPGYKINVRFNVPMDSYFGFNIKETLLCSIFSKTQSYINTNDISDEWTNRGYDFAKKMAHQRSLYFQIIAAALLIILFLMIFFLIKNKKTNQKLDRMVNEMTLDLRESVAQLQAVISNYSGAIWSVDKDNTITLFNGMYLNRIGVTPDYLEGKQLEMVREKPKYKDIIEHIEQSFAEGKPQDWISNIDGKMFLSRITPMFDQAGEISGVVGNIDDITESIRLQKELEIALEKAEAAVREAEAANKAKSSFLSTMSHEIRTPMNAILGITEIQLQNDALDHDVKEALSRVHSSGDLLLGIINDILDLSKIEAGKLELVIEEYMLDSLISDTAQLNMMRIGGKPIAFKLFIDENLPACLLGDELRVKQILNNVLSNAFKYTAAGTVKLSVVKETANGGNNEVTLAFIISDTGQGMTKEQMNIMYDEYARFNMEANRSTEGTGLGMTITRNLVRLMNGEISIESKPGQGTTVTVILPQGRIGSEILGREKSENLQMFRTGSRAQMKRVQITREPMPYGSVLIVDDVETNIYVAQGLLSPYKLKIDSADSGYAAIEKIKRGNIYDIVFMDHMMPKMDGMETTKIIRGIGYELPIVALTANAVTGQAEIFLGSGFDDYISKPIDVRQLNAVLNKFIRDKQPPEIIERARKQREEDKTRVVEKTPQLTINPRFAEIFARDAQKALTALEALYEKIDGANEDDLRSYIINVHGMKGALANIGQTDLSAVAAKLETAGREGKFEIISSETSAFLCSLQAYIEEITTRKEASAGVKRNEDKAFLGDQLLAIIAACAVYDATTAHEALAELGNKTWSQQTKELLDIISDQLLHSDFNEIINGINQYIKKTGL